MFPLVGYFKNSKLNKLKLKAAYLKRQVAPFHSVLSTLKIEGKNTKLIADVLADIQARERVLASIEKRIRARE